MTEKTALITGSSRGIGRETAIELALKGYKVFIHFASYTDSANAVKTEFESLGGEAEVIRYDLCDSSHAKKIIDITGGVDALILNASEQIRRRRKKRYVVFASRCVNAFTA